MFYRIIQPFELKFRKPIAILKIQSMTKTSSRQRFGNRRQWNASNFKPLNH